MDDLLPGSVLAFSTRDMVADAINVLSLRPWGWYHHLAIVSEGDKSEPFIYEAVNSERPPCYWTNKRESCLRGYPASELLEFMRPRSTKIYCFPLRCPLYVHESERLESWLRQRVGLPYDLTSAWHSGGGWLFRTLSFLIRGESLAELFCSETVAGALTYVGRIKTRSASHWNPNSLTSFLKVSGTCESKPIRLL